MVLFLDANENMRKGKLQQVLTKLDMHDTIKHRAKVLGPATWYQGKDKLMEYFYCVPIIR